MPQNRELKKLSEIFHIPPGETKKIIKDFHSEMRKGLSGSGSLKMIPTYVERPSGSEKGEFLALDLGGTNFRVLALKLKGRRKKGTLIAEKFALKKKHITGRGEELFDFIADCIKRFMQKHNINPDREHKVGFTFSFPMKKTSVASGVLLGWTKGFKASGVEGKDVVKLLNQSLERKGFTGTQVVSIANDTVGTFVARSYGDPNCDVGVILGTGTNACYCEKILKIPKWKGAKTPSGEVLINMEWGNFNKIRLTPYDKRLDRFSANPGKQLLEKMVSGMYLGELARLAIKDMMAKKVLFAGKKNTVFEKRRQFNAEDMAIAEGDNTKKLSRTGALLKKIGISNSSYTARVILKDICRAVSGRAAHISAIAITAVATKIDPDLFKKHTIAIDGSVYEKHPGFSGKIRASLKKILKKKSKNIKLTLTKDGSGKGAAIIAATVRQGQISYQGGVS